MTLRWKLVNLSSSNIPTQAGSKENVENRCFIAEARKRKTECLCKWFCLRERRAFAERPVCAKRVYFWYVSFNYQQSKSEKRQPSPNNLLQRRCPSAESPAPRRDLSRFMTGHKGTQPFYLNLFWESCLLDVDFQQPLPSEKNIHGRCFTSNANGTNLNPPYTPYLWLVSYIFTAIYTILQKNVYERGCALYWLLLGLFLTCVLEKRAENGPSRKAGSEKGQRGNKSRSPETAAPPDKSSFRTNFNVTPNNFYPAAVKGASQLISSPFCFLCLNENYSLSFHWRGWRAP